MAKGEKKAKTAGFKTVNFDVEEKIMGALNQDSLESVLEWQVVNAGSGEDKFFLVIKLHAVDDIPNISGDFKIKFESDGPKCKFYFWLNVAAIQYNEQLKEVSARRSGLRESSPASKLLLTKQSLSQQGQEPGEEPIHFEEISEVSQKQS